MNAPHDPHNPVTGNLWKHLAHFAIPSVLGLLCYAMQSLVDGMIVSRYVGPDALGGVNIVMPCYSLIGVWAIMVGIGSQTIVTISRGAGDHRRAQDSMSSGFLLLIGAGILIAFIMYSVRMPLLSLLGADSRLMPYAERYLVGWIFFVPVFGCLLYFDYMLKAFGKTRTAMAVMITTVALNGLLSLLFVIGLGMGTFGAGLATGISITIGTLLDAWALTRDASIYPLLKGRFRWNLVGKMTYNGSSEGVSELSGSVCMILMNMTLMKYGGADAVVAFTVINYLYFMGITFYLGVSDGIIPIIGYNYGARKPERVWGIITRAAKVNFCVGVLLFLLLRLGGGSFADIFFDKGNEALSPIITEGIHVYAYAFLICGLNILAASVFTAIENARTSIIISLLRGIIFIIIGLQIFPPIFGLDGIWMTIPLSELATFGIAFYLILKLRKKLFCAENPLATSGNNASNNRPACLSPRRANTHDNLKAQDSIE